MDVLVLQCLPITSGCHKVLVQHSHRQEVRPRLALEAGADLDHPVGHLGAELSRDRVSLEGIIDCRGRKGHVGTAIDTAKSSARIYYLTTLQRLLDVLQLVAVEGARALQTTGRSMELAQGLLHLVLIILGQ